MKKAVLIIVMLIFSVGTLQAKEVQQEQKIDLSALQVENDSEDQEMMQRLKTKKVMMDWHAITAWTTVGLMIGAMATAPDDKADSTHKWLGIASGVTYLTSASLAVFAPKFEGAGHTPNILIHEKLAIIHVPAMILTAITGIAADKKYRDGKKLGSFEKSHKIFIPITAISFGLAAFTSTNFSLKFLPTPKKQEIACLITKTF